MRCSLYFAKRIIPSTFWARVKNLVLKVFQMQIHQSTTNMQARWQTGSTQHIDQVGNGHNPLQTKALLDHDRLQTNMFLGLATIINKTLQLEFIFGKRCSLHELIVGNDTAFSSSIFKAFMEEWGIQQHFQCAHVLSGNVLMKRCHKTVKPIAARNQCAIQEAVYWYNTTLKDSTLGPTAPTNTIYSYEIQLKSIDAVTSPKPTIKHNIYKTEDIVWVKQPLRGTSKFMIGKVTGIISLQSILVDGMLHHGSLTNMGSTFCNKWR